MKKTFLIQITSLVLLFLFTFTIVHAASPRSVVSNSGNLSKNDQLFREDIRYRLDAGFQKQVDTIITLYKAKIATLDKTNADRITDIIIRKIDSILHTMSISQPLDKTLSRKASNKYLIYTLLRFELMMLK